MALLSKKEFAAQILKSTKWLSNYITRQQVVVRDDGKIDTTNATNKAFLEKFGYAKQLLTAPAVQETEPQPSAKPKTALKLVLNAEDDETVNIPGINWDLILQYDKGIRLKTHNEAIKKEKEIEKLDLEIKKKQGEVVPVAPIEVLIFQFKQVVLTQSKTTYEAFLTEIGHKYEITGEDHAYYRSYYINLLNKSVEEATTIFLQDLGTVLNDFSVKRGVGERN
jgi:hypothetical protein